MSKKYQRSFSRNKINVRFYLLFPDLDTSGIKISVSYRGKRLRMNIPLAITTKYWNAKSQRLLQTAPAATLYNNILDKLETAIIEKLLNPAYSWADETALNLKDTLLDLVMPESKRPVKEEPKPVVKSFIEHFTEYIDERQTNDQTIKKQSIKTIRTTLKHLSGFVELTEYDLNFETINQNFLNRFQTYLTHKNIQNSTQQRHLKNIKAFMSKMKDHHNNMEYKHLQVKTKESEIITLTIDEIKHLQEAALGDKLSKIRDVFLCQCFTGLRVSDLKKIREHNIDFNDMTLRVRQTKTGELHYIPLFDSTMTILKKYDYWLPTISDQRYNSYIKDLCKAAGVNDLVDKTINIGNKTITKTFPKYELITSHIARKTFITVCLDSGLPVAKVMNLSGHTDYKSFKRYVNLSKKKVAADSGKELNNVFK